MLLYHQLVEQMVQLLIEDTRFFVQLAVFPLRLDFPRTRRRTFGQSLAELEGAFEFPSKSRFVASAATLNEIRNTLVHSLGQRESLAGLARTARRARSLERRAYRHFDAAHGWFRVCFKDFLKSRD